MPFASAVPELAVKDVKSSQAYYRDTLGFQIAWYNEPGDIGAVRRDDWTVFFRGTYARIVPATHWIFCPDIDEAFADFTARGAEIETPLEDTTWGLRQFTLQDNSGHRYHIFVDP